ncbi:MAG: sugar lactone lactonase YvrE [Myxococcota bacterium]|jgi:sugar lactone lactonase YvrE
MKRILIAIGVLLAALLGYLTLAPTPIQPVAWEVPEDAGFIGDYAPNDDLAGVEVTALPDGHGPEDVEVDASGRIYTGLQDGRILRWATPDATPEVFADTGGRPLGLHWDGAGNLLVADAFAGLLSIAPDGTITTLLTEVDGPMVFTDDLEITVDGVIYVSDASVRFDQHHWKLDIIESGPSGRLIAYDTATGKGRVVLDELYFANGVAIDPAQQFVLVNETSRYRIRKVWIAGEKAGTDEIIVDNLPGFPDGISTGTGGVFWLALAGPRDVLLDLAAGSPRLRKVMTRLPDAIQPAPVRYGHVVGLDSEGTVRCSLQNPSGEAFAIITSVQERDGWLYLGSLSEPAFARIPVPQRCRG